MRSFALALLVSLTLAACGGRSTDESPDETAPADNMTAVDPGARPDPSNAASAPEGEVPVGWQIRFDHDSEYTVGNDADSSDVFFVTMTPGWHVTTRPAGVFWHPASTASGSYTARTVIHLFDPGDRNEAFGLVFGGRELDGPDQAYTYFLVRRSGDFLVKRRMGEDTEELVGWTAHDAVEAYTEETTGTVRYELAVTVDPESVQFLVGGVEVASLPSADIDTDGLVALRVNHALNVHVEDLSVEQAGAM